MNKFLYYLISIIFVISFFKGILYIIGFDMVLVQLFIELLILILFGISIFYVSKKQKFLFYNFIVILLFLLITLTSFFFNNTNVMQLVLFYRVFFIYYIFFFSILNLNINKKYNDKIIKLIIFLFLLQIPAAFIKLFLIGTEEFFIGTMSYLGGDIATIMPLMATSFLISNYLVYKKKQYIFLIFLFIAIGLISNKLGIIYYVALLFVFLSYMYSLQQTKKLISFTLLKRMLSLIIIFLIIFVLYVKLNPRANPEHKVWGSIDIEYLIEYTERYNTTVLDDNVEGDGRFDAPFVALSRISDGGGLNILFGFGPGDIVKSSYIPHDNPLLEKYYIGYGGRLGVVWTLMQIGILGTVVYITYHVLFFLKVIRIYLKRNFSARDNILLLTVIGFIFIYFLDFFSYGMVTMKVPGVVLTYFFSIYYVVTVISKGPLEMCDKKYNAPKI